jgi:glycosyltransferase involved in cell wall biosynthesis
VKPGHLAIICGVLDTMNPVSQQAIALADEMLVRGYHVSLLAMTTNETDLDPRIRLITAGPMPRHLWVGMVPYLRWLTRTLDDIKPDHTISMLSTVPASIMVPVTGTRLARRRASQTLDKRIIEGITLRLRQLRPSRFLMNWLERRAISSTQIKTFVALTPLIRQSLEADDRIQNHAIESACTSITTESIDQVHTKQVREQLARAFGIDPDSYWIVLPFTDARLDGFEGMIRAFAPLIKQGVDTTLLLAGPTRYTHLTWLGELGLRDRVRLLGKTPHLEELLAASDLVANPTGYDPLGIVVRQAIAAGTPIITTNASGQAEAAREEIDTVLPPPVEPEAMLQAIHEQYERRERNGLKSPSNAHQGASQPALGEVIDRMVRDIAA